MATSTPALSLDGPVPPGPSVAPSALEMAAAAPPESASESVLRIIGTLMMALGVLAMLIGAVANREWSGATVGSAVFTIVMGLAMRFPTMLQDGTMTEDRRPAYSSMRVVMLLVTGTFILLTVKAGWTTQSLDQLKVDQSWALVLGVVLGGKVFQGMAEANAQKK
jgi:small-conductance mechanosensitive channel